MTLRLAYNPGPLNCYPGILRQSGSPAVRQSGSPAVRLAYHPEGSRKSMKNDQQQDLLTGSPAVRLACCPASESGGANSVRHHVNECGLGKPDVRFALSGEGGDKSDRPLNLGPQPTVRLAQGDGALAGKEGNGPLMDSCPAPALLVSYYYLEPFEKNKHLYRYRDWVMDSGAFSAHNSGKHIDLQAYVDKCLELLASDPTLTEVFSLDVIPKDHKPATVQHAAEQSLKNCEEMWRQGVPAIPTFHRGEDEEFLYAMAKDYPKIAIGGVALLRGDQKFLFCEQVFARVWPKKVHGLGMASEELVYGLPFHSVDATNWEMAPCAFGNWQKFGQMSVRGSSQDLRSQVKHYLDLEAKARVRCAKQMAELERLGPSTAKLGSPVIRPMRSTGRELAGNASDASSASRTVGAGALDAGAAGGERSAAVLSNQKPVPKRKEQRPAAPAKKTSAELEVDDKWASWRPS